MIGTIGYAPIKDLMYVLCVSLKLLTSGKLSHEVTRRLDYRKSMSETYKGKFLPLGRFTKYERLHTSSW